ncbi:MAG: uracil phosphoribosyltransferase [Bdellovibrionales bacterium]|nr:uracil phosphoribosyltransferase [Bdellovibrionales bacterium]
MHQGITHYSLSELEHKYPDNVHILNHPTVTSLLAKLCLPETTQPEFNRLIESLYSTLFVEAINAEWPLMPIELNTRMTVAHPDCQYVGHVLDRQQRGIVVAMARAGILPSQLGFDLLCQLVNSNLIRQDHVFASRVADANDQVTHTNLYGSKIGGDIDECIIFLPDPMGATGHSISTTIDHYKKNVAGKEKKFIAIHLIVTPEYIRHVTEKHPDVIIYTARLDRGLSSDKVLKSIPGTYWNEEKGLNDKQYIVPGAGGVGELINNSFV